VACDVVTSTRASKFSIRSVETISSEPPKYILSQDGTRSFVSVAEEPPPQEFKKK